MSAATQALGRAAALLALAGLAACQRAPQEAGAARPVAAAERLAIQPAPLGRVETEALPPLAGASAPAAALVAAPAAPSAAPRVAPLSAAAPRVAPPAARPFSTPPAPAAGPQVTVIPPAGRAGPALTAEETRRLAAGLAACWTQPAPGPAAELRLRLDRAGAIREVSPGPRGLPADPRARAVYDSARRGLLSPRCASQRVPPDKAQTVMASTFRFDPRGPAR